ncbi:MAG: sugar nucleotide-binding protein [Clostridia bacterium]|nr:sugar nucleotide-binding protein [Clostridia bacterium]
MYCIAGADGFLGAYLQRELLAKGETVVALNHTAPVFPDGDNLYNLPFELTDRASMDAAEALLRRFDDIRVFYTIAVHAPDKVEADPAFAHRINHVLYAEFLRKLSGCDITQLYYASTDNVYGESRDGKVFTEEDAPAPINAYGEQKAEAERITREQGFSVARFSYMFGPSLTHKPHFFDVITQKLKTGQPMEMFTDFIRSSLPYPAAARCLIRLAEADTKETIVNICADEPTSKYDIGLFAADYCGADRSLVIPARGMGSGLFTAARAPSIVMSNARLKRAVGDKAAIKPFPDI